MLITFLLVFVLLASTTSKSHPFQACHQAVNDTLSKKLWDVPISNELLLLERQLGKLVATSFHEGHSSQLGIEPKVYLALARLGPNCIHHICETGFNAGHSALRWLYAAPQAHVHMFDLWQYPHANGPGQQFILSHMAHAKANLEIIKGNSFDTVLDWHSAHPTTKCNIISVDGGHQFEVAYADIQNFRFVADPNFHIIFLDDTNCDIAPCRGPNKALAEHERQGTVKVIARWRESKSRGFTLLQYTNLTGP